MSKVPTNHIVSISNNLLKNIDKDNETIKTNSETIKNNTIIKNKEKRNDGKSQTNLANGSIVWADSTRVPTEDELRRDGWQWKNKILNERTCVV